MKVNNVITFTEFTDAERDALLCTLILLREVICGLKADFVEDPVISNAYDILNAFYTNSDLNEILFDEFDNSIHLAPIFDKYASFVNNDKSIECIKETFTILLFAANNLMHHGFEKSIAYKNLYTLEQILFNGLYSRLIKQNEV